MAPAPSPRGETRGGGPRRGDRGTSWGPHSTTIRPLRPPPQRGRGRGSGRGRMEGRGRRGHSRLERVLNGGGHGPLGWAASGPGRRCRRARAQPGLRRPLCRPARYDFIHSWGCSARGAGRAGGGPGEHPAFWLYHLLCLQALPPALLRLLPGARRPLQDAGTGSETPCELRTLRPRRLRFRLSDAKSSF